MNNILNCTKCTDFLHNKKVMKLNKNKHKNIQDEQTNDYCKSHCTNGLIYNFIAEKWDINNTSKSNIDSYKIIKNFYQDKLIYNYDEIPYKLNFEPNMPKPKSVIHWGQLKMFLVTLLFLVKKIKQEDEEVHIIYPGSARGDNILILCDMFPNTFWYLIDPLPFHPKLNNHKQIKEIKNEYFTDETAKYYAKKFKNRNHKLFLLSDIRVNTNDKSIIENQESNATGII